MKSYYTVGKHFKAVMTGAILCTVLFHFSTQGLAARTKAAPKTAAKTISLAQDKGQYLFLLFYDNRPELYYDNSELLLKEMEIAASNFRNESSEKILIQKVLVTDDKEKDIVSKYAINPSRLPVLLILAPNGAVTGVFPKRATVQNFTQSIVSKLTMTILKSIQEKKIALVLFQNSSTKFNEESSKAVKEFAGDSVFKGKVVVIKADPAENEAKNLLTQINDGKPISESTIVLIVSPGSVVGVFSGIITKERIIGALSSGATCNTGTGSTGGSGTTAGGGCCGAQ